MLSKIERRWARFPVRGGGRAWPRSLSEEVWGTSVAVLTAGSLQGSDGRRQASLRPGDGGKDILDIERLLQDRDAEQSKLIAEVIRQAARVRRDDDEDVVGP